MLDAIKPLLESGLINEETSTALNEAWESKLNEALSKYVQSSVMSSHNVMNTIKT